MDNRYRETLRIILYLTYYILFVFYVLFLQTYSSLHSVYHKRLYNFIRFSNNFFIRVCSQCMHCRVSKFAPLINNMFVILRRESAVLYIDTLVTWERGVVLEI